MAKFYTGLAVFVAIFLTSVMGAMRGGQILKQPLPYTVYILTGDRNDVFYSKKFHRQTHGVQGGGNATERNLNIGNPEAGGASNSTKTQVVEGKNGTSASEDVTLGGGVRTGKEKEERGRSSRIDGKLFLSSAAARGQNELIKDDKSQSRKNRASKESNSGKNENLPSQKQAAEVQNESTPGDGGVNVASAEKPVKSHFISTETKLKNPPAAAGNGVAPVEKSGFVSDKIAPKMKRSLRNNDDTHPESSSTPTTIQSELSGNTEHSHTSSSIGPSTDNAVNQSVKLWRYCMGVIYDDSTILTADICIVKTDGLHFFISVNETNHGSAQKVTMIADGRSHFDVRVILLNENQTMPGLLPDWQDEDTVYWKLEELSNSTTTGIVPSFGYPPMVAALKLLPMDTCKTLYYELLELYPAQTATLPGLLHDTVVCATQADKPIDFPEDGVGLVQPGLACPDSLGAPFVLLDGTILGVLVAADCKDKHVAFFQTLGRGMPHVEDEEDETVASLNEKPAQRPRTQIHAHL